MSYIQYNHQCSSIEDDGWARAGVGRGVVNQKLLAPGGRWLQTNKQTKKGAFKQKHNGIIHLRHFEEVSGSILIIETLQFLFVFILKSSKNGQIYHPRLGEARIQAASH